MGAGPRRVTVDRSDRQHSAFTDKQHSAFTDRQHSAFTAFHNNCLLLPIGVACSTDKMIDSITALKCHLSQYIDRIHYLR